MNLATGTDLMIDEDNSGFVNVERFCKVPLVIGMVCHGCCGVLNLTVSDELNMNTCVLGKLKTEMLVQSTRLYISFVCIFSLTRPRAWSKTSYSQ